MKYNLDTLNIEITRKCNYKCFHCMNGQAQNISITKEIIDKMFSQIDTCKNIYLGSGEVLLELDMIQYLINSIDKYKLNVEHIQLTTNGSILDERLIKIIKPFTNKDKKRDCLIRISDDIFHNKQQSIKAYNFYHSLVDDLDRIEIHYTSTEAKTYYAEDDYSDCKRFILFSGNAKKYINTNINEYINNEEQVLIYYADSQIHQIKVVDNNIYCGLELCVNGNLTFISVIREYDEKDKLIIGNVLESPLNEIINNHNNNCLYLCSECDYERTQKTLIDFGYINLKSKTFNEKNVFNYFYQLYLYKVHYYWKIREIAHQKHINIPVRQLIKMIPLINNDEWIKYITNKFINDDVEKILDSQLKILKKQHPLESDENVKNSVLGKFLCDKLNKYIINLNYDKLDNELKDKLFNQEQINLKLIHLGTPQQNEKVVINLSPEII